MEIEEEYNQFLQDLPQDTIYFQMGNHNCSINFWRKIPKKMEDEKVELLEFSDLVRIKNQNLEACALYYLGDVDKAEEIISKVLEETNSTSINACALMAILNYTKGEITQAKRYLNDTKELAANPYNIDVAKSELAYAYTRLDATFYKEAIALYTEVVERNPTNIPWIFGLAVLYRRCMTTSILAMFPDLQLETCFNEAEKYLTYILENCNKQDLFFKASSYIELADLYFVANTTDKFTETDERQIIDLVNQGVQCLPKNITILRKAGRILENCSKFKEAEELLQKAYDICPNSYICHHLGLSQMKNIIHQHRQSQQECATPQVNVLELTVPINVSKQALTEPKPILKHDEDIKTTELDDPSKALSTGGPTILPNESMTKKKQAETVTNTAKAGKEPVTVRESSTPPPVSSWPTSAIEKSDLPNHKLVKRTRLINSPKKETFDLELSRKLEPCLDLFKQSAELGQEQNLRNYYDWGITLLQMIPTKFDEVMKTFNHILANDRSPFMRYRCYEQCGICKLRMSESQDFNEISRKNYQEDAKEMFRRAIRCWAYCQKIKLSEHFEDPEGNCNSFVSIREILLGGDEGDGTKSKKEMASLYFLFQQFVLSLSLYQEVHDELQRTSVIDSEVIEGIINNHLQLQEYTGVLDLLTLLLCLKGDLQCLELKTNVLTQMMHYAIDKHDYQLSKSVFNFEKDQNEECDNDVLIIFNEKYQVTKTKGATLQNWLSTFSKSGLKVIKITETAANLPGPQEQVKLICNSKMAIFILANETPELTYFMNTAIKAQLDNNYFLKKIFPIVINDGMVPDIFNIFRYMKINHQPNTADEQDKSEFLKTFSEIFLEKPT